MKLSRRMVALTAITATCLTPALMPGAALARPVLGNQISNVEDHDKLGVRAITAVDQQTLLPGQQFKVSVLFTQDYDQKIFPKFTGVGFDKELMDAIDQGNASAKQLTSAAEIKDAFPESTLAKLPSQVKIALDNGSWQPHSRNQQSTDTVEFGSANTSISTKGYYAFVKDANYTTDFDGLGEDGIIALEFTFNTKTSAPALSGAQIGAYISNPNNSASIPQYEINWAHLLGAVAVDVRKEADVEILTPTGEHTPGETVTLKARVNPSQYQGNVTFNIGGQIKQAAVVNQMATTEYVMGEQPVNLRAEISANQDFSAAISDYVRLSPKAPVVETPPPATEDPAQPAPKDPSPKDPKPAPDPAPTPNPSPEKSSSVGEYWWAILLAILGVLGIGGGAFAWSNGLIR